RVLLLVRDDQVGREIQDRWKAWVLRPPDAGYPGGDLERQLAVVRSTHERIPTTERGNAEGIARHQRHDARRRDPKSKMALQIVFDLYQRHLRRRLILPLSAVPVPTALRRRVRRRAPRSRPTERRCSAAGPSRHTGPRSLPRARP